VSLQPGQSKRVTLTADARLLGRFDGSAGRWRIAAGRYRIAVGKSAGDLCLHAEVRLAARVFGT
jgi:beta-glucosidase